MRASVHRVHVCSSVRACVCAHARVTRTCEHVCVRACANLFKDVESGCQPRVEWFLQVRPAHTHPVDAKSITDSRILALQSQRVGLSGSEHSFVHLQYTQRHQNEHGHWHTCSTHNDIRLSVVTGTPTAHTTTSE